MSTALLRLIPVLLIMILVPGALLAQSGSGTRAPIPTKTIDTEQQNHSHSQQQIGSGEQTFANERPITITGTVVDEFGNPLRSAKVTRLGAGGGSVWTDANGQFRLSIARELAAETISLTAEHAQGETSLWGTAQIEPSQRRNTVTIVARQLCELGWSEGLFCLQGVDGVVNAAVAWDNGKGAALYVGGAFSIAGCEIVTNFAKWDGTKWTALGAGMNNPVVTVLSVFDDGTGEALYAGGQFSSAGAFTVNNIAKWDGTQWMPLNSPGGTGVIGAEDDTFVSALTVFNDGTGPALYVGGRFTTAGGVQAQNIARWDGTQWTPLGSGVTGGFLPIVLALATFDDGDGEALYAGGDFTVAGGILVNNIARWNGDEWSSLSTGVTRPGASQVNALAVFDDDSGEGPGLYVGGLFTSAGGGTVNNIAKWNGAQWFPLNTLGGTGVSGSVRALTVFDDDSGSGPALYAGGDFTTAGGVSVNRIARWDGMAWSALGLGVSGGDVSALGVFDNGTGEVLYALGLFSTAGGVTVNRIARWDGSSWSPLATPEGTGPSGGVRALAVFNDGTGSALYVGGRFTTAGGIDVNHIAKWDGSQWSELIGPAGRGLGGVSFPEVGALTVFNDGTGSALYVGGSFTEAGGTTANYIARWNGASWSPLGLGLNGSVSALTVFNDGLGEALYAGGFFTEAGGTTANYIARWNGASWSPLGLGLNGSVSALKVFDDGSGSGPTLHAGGNFTQAVGGSEFNRIVRWDGSSWSSLGSGLNNAVVALTVFDDGTGPALYAGGGFTQAGGSPASRIARWNGSSWSPLGSGLSGPSFPAVYALTVFDDGAGPALYAGGNFTLAGGGPASRIARWDGAAWSTLGSGVNSLVWALTLFNDGTGEILLAGGDFTQAGGTVSARIARWGCRGLVEMPPIDLAIASGTLTSSTTIVAGEAVSADVTIRNDGELPYEGPAVVSLRAGFGATPTPGDLVLANVNLGTVTLEPGQSMQFPIVGVAPLVLPESRRDLFASVRGIGEEADESNNSLQIGEVDLVPLSVGQDGVFFSLAPGESILIPIDLDSETGVHADLISDLASGSIDLFAGPGSFVTTTQNEVSTLPSFSPMQTLAIPTESISGRWHLLARARSTNTQIANCLLRLDPAPLSLTSVDRTSVSALPSVSLDVRGSGMPLDAEFFLSPGGGGGVEIHAVSNVVVNSVRATPRFDLTGVESGEYILHVLNPSTMETTALAQLIMITPPSQSGGSGLRATLSAPEFVRTGASYSLLFSYRNDGDADLPAPVFTIRGTNGFRREIVARGRSGNIDIMLPGESGPGLSTTQRQMQDGVVTYTVSVLDYQGQPFDWEEFSRLYRPLSAVDSEWQVGVTALADLVGSDYADIFSISRRIPALSPGAMLAGYSWWLAAPFSEARTATAIAWSKAADFRQSMPTAPNWVTVSQIAGTIGAGTSPPIIVISGWCGLSSCDPVTGSASTISTSVNTLAQQYADYDGPVITVSYNGNGAPPLLIDTALKNNADLTKDDIDIVGRNEQVAAIAFLELRDLGIDVSSAHLYTHSNGTLVGNLISELNVLATGQPVARQIMANAPSENLWKKFTPNAPEVVYIGGSWIDAAPFEALPGQKVVNIRLSQDACEGVSCLHSEGMPWVSRLLTSEDAELRALGNAIISGDISFLLSSPLTRGWQFEIDAQTGALTAITALEDGSADVQFSDQGLPTIPETPIGSATTTALAAFDPNDIIGPAGFGPERWIAADLDLMYTIRFENLEDATAPAAEVIITQTLDPNLDPATVEFLAFGLGDDVYTIPNGSPVWEQRLDFRSTLDVYADISFDCDPVTGEMRLYFAAIDPLTGSVPFDPRVGLVPPNTEPPIGEGWIAYRVRPKQGLTTGTVIEAEASIVFDFNDPIETPRIFNTIDADPPQTQIGFVPGSSAKTIRVPWEQIGAEIGSPLRYVYLYASKNDGPFELVASVDVEESTELSFVGSAFNQYRLSVVGVDAVGNVEPGKQVGTLPWTRVFDAVPDDVLDPQDFYQFLNWYVEGDMRADVNRDGVIDATDFQLVVEGVLGR